MAIDKSSKKADAKAAKRAKEEGKKIENPQDRVGPRSLLLGMFIVLVLTSWIGGASWARSDAEGRCAFPLRLLLMFALEAVFSPICSAIWLLPARLLAPHLPGAAPDPSLPASSLWPSAHEMQHNDETIKWPRPEHLPVGWASLSRGRKQPFFLNHVRGAMRLRQAAIRLGAGTATCVTLFCMSRLVDRRPVTEFGLYLDASAAIDALLGVLTGTTCIVVLFLMEWHLGWIVPTHTFECVVDGENWSLNILWDVLFHLGVSFNEELQLRGWLLHSAASAFEAYLGSSASSALLLAAVVESLLFAAMHFFSPGSSTLALVNLTIGGMVAALNVVLSRGLAFALGWHFAWNLTMGHLLGLSTSGIPMSAKLISVVPHPSKAGLHGGTFGPEKSVLAPGIYLLGCSMLLLFYGWQ